MTIEQARDVLRIEAEGILNLIDRVDAQFDKMVDLICRTKGRLIVSGIGKSGIVGQKIVATLNSTGTRSVFLHPVEAMHGDLGIVSSRDVFLALSNSGETDELNILIPSIRNIGCAIIAFTGNINSTLAKNSDIVIDVGVEKEACPLGLAPTASTTAALAMGDALAVVLIDRKHFKSSDFKKIHPGGSLGQRLSLQVADIMFGRDAIPLTLKGTALPEAIKTMDNYRLGVTLIIEDDQALIGILTDGDLRRLLLKTFDIEKVVVEQVMTEAPKAVYPDTPVYDALNIMEQNQITVLPVIDPHNHVQGVLHLHDILGKGAFQFVGQ